MPMSPTARIMAATTWPSASALLADSESVNSIPRGLFAAFKRSEESQHHFGRDLACHRDRFARDFPLKGVKHMINDSERPDGTQLPAWTLPVLIVLALVGLAGLGMAWSASGSARDTREVLTRETQSMKQTYDKNIESLRDDLRQAKKNSTDLQGDLGVVTKRLQTTQGALQKAREEAEQARRDASAQLAEMDSQVEHELATK